MGIYVGNKRYAPYIGDKRRRYMGGGSALPYDAELEYLESTGTQWIDTGYLPSSLTCIEAFFSIVRYSTLYSPLFYCGNTYNDPGTFGASFLRTERILLYYGSKLNIGVPITISYGDRLQIYMDINNAILEDITTTTIYRVAIGSTYQQGDRTLYLFNGNTNTSDLHHPSCMRVERFKITENNNLLYDFIPVRVGQTGYMYDKVSGQLFGNSGTGDFVLGPDKT